jgi:thiol:disulfide interchange protein DsbD
MTETSTQQQGPTWTRRIATTLFWTWLIAQAWCGTSGNRLLAQGHDVKVEPPTWTERLAPATPVPVGAEVTLHFTATLKPGLHIFTVVPLPPGQVGYLPTQLEFEDINGQYVAVGNLTEQGKRITKFDDIFEVNVHYFEQTVTFSQKIKVLKPNPTVSGFLRFQVCSETQCLPFEYNFRTTIRTSEAAPAQPATTEAATPMTVDTGLAAAPVDTAAPRANPSTQATTVQPLPTVSAKSKGQPLFWTFLTAFLGGFLAIFTPCVFPLIPSNIGFFIKRASSPAAAKRDAVLLFLSIVVTFIGLGSVLALIFGAGSLNDLATNGWVNLVFFALLVFFGLSFLGWYELTLPASWSTKADELSGKGGILGIYAWALVLVIGSFSCVGPLLGAYLPLLADGTVATPLVGMTGFSVGFALPFMLFAWFPSTLKKLPKSGGWLNVLKVVLGFLELALAFKFLSNTDLQWDWHLLTREVFLAVWLVLFLLLGLYLLGFYRLPHDLPEEKISVPRLLLAIASLTMVFYLLPGLWGAPLKQLSGILPPSNHDLGVRIAPVHAATVSGTGGGGQEVCSLDRKYSHLFAEHAPTGFCPFFDLDEALEYARKVRKPVFVDYTGVNCANCREVESYVWTDPEIKRILTTEYVMVSLFTDKGEKLPEKQTMPDGTVLRTIGDKWKYHEKTRYQQIGQPFYVLVNEQGTDLVPQGLSYTRDIAAYKAFLLSGLEAWKTHNLTAR